MSKFSLKIIRRPDGVKKAAHISDREFYLRSFTWGLPCNIGGSAVALALLAAGRKPHKYGKCIQFDVGNLWGGGSLGIFMFTGKNVPERIKAHEHGHSIQNCYYGPFMPLLVNVPSSSRFWYRKAAEKLCPGRKLPPYDSAWFEAEASALGREYMKNAQEN